MNLEELRNWEKAWKELEKQAHITLEQVGLIMPAIEKKIKELEELELEK